MRIFFLATFILVNLLHMNYGADLTCKDNNGKPVDWFIALKVHNGYSFYYMDARNTKLTFSPVDLDQSNQAIGYTLQPLYSNSTGLLYVAYNDEPPRHKVSFTYGHTKGVLMSDDSSGFWLVHSVPKFPDVSQGKYTFAPNAKSNGQSFLCITIPYSEMDTIGQIYRFNRPYFFVANLPPSMKKSLPNFDAVLNQKAHVKTPPWSQRFPLKTKGGVPLDAFAKASGLKQDLYAGLVAPFYNSDLAVETWVRQHDPLCSNCSASHKVFNICSLRLSDGPHTHRYNVTQDHSKWALTLTKKQVVCIGDINKDCSQFHRGGGTVCLDIPAVHSAFKSSILERDDCSGTTSCSLKTCVESCSKTSPWQHMFGQEQPFVQKQNYGQML